MENNISFSISTKLADYIAKTIPHIESQRITWCYIPDFESGVQFQKTSKFCAVEISSGAIGVSFASYIPPDSKNGEASKSNRIIGKPASSFVPLLGQGDALPIERALAMAVINALSTKYMQEKALTRQLLFEDGVTTLDIQPTDRIGMVGMFSPLIPTIIKQAEFLHIVELKPELVQLHENWEVTTDNTILKKCNKIIVTGSILLNGTLSSLLDLISHAEHVALIGPTASFLPDPLFDLGFDIIGGTIVVKPSEFKSLIVGGLAWGNSAKKFVVRKDHWHHTSS